ncbi:UpaP162 family type II restriction enzyme [Metamycoplasma equirhinis]|uniref:UpaP162 family type II restriction enzyme n=1 Tax=Metamycoplasma equirhinis TaxID=92402 RepID=UPI0035945BB4
MVSNSYWDIAQEFKSQIELILKTIFNINENKLTLTLNNTNLISKEGSCCANSSVLGFLLEEFVFQQLKLASYNSNFTIFHSENIQNCSYDFTSIFKNQKFLINFKVTQGNNNAVACLRQLVNDYIKESDYQLHFMVIKLEYEVDLQLQKIIIKNLNSYFLEQIDFSNEFKCDKRRWSENQTSNLSGRLQVSNNFLQAHQKNETDISYESTRESFLTILNN